MRGCALPKKKLGLSRYARVTWHIIGFHYVMRRPCWCTKQWQNVAQALHNNGIKFPKDLFHCCCVHQHGSRDVTWKPRIGYFLEQTSTWSSKLLSCMEILLASADAESLSASTRAKIAEAAREGEGDRAWDTCLRNLWISSVACSYRSWMLSLSWVNVLTFSWIYRKVKAPFETNGFGRFG